MASGFQKYVAMGNLTRDPELRTTQGGTDICNFDIAINETILSSDAQRKIVFYVACKAFGKMGSNIAKYASKGSTLFIEGRFRSEEWTDRQGQKRVSNYLLVETFRFCGGKQVEATNAKAQSSLDLEDDNPPF